jgi:hypothetical protein
MPKKTNKGYLVGKPQSIVIPAPLPDLLKVGFGQGGLTDQLRFGEVGHRKENEGLVNTFPG